MSILKKLTIENFKGIGQKVSFDFKPITLFFGQNSAGKSTVLHALNYLHDILNLHTINADNTSLGHGSIDLGGFKHFVHKHDLQRTINLSLEIDMSSQDLIETDSANLFNELQRLFPGEFVHGELIDLSHISNRIETSKIDIEIAWSDLLKKPYVKSLCIAFNDKPILKVVSSSTCARIEITQINLSHSIFLGTESDDEVIYLYPLIENIIQERYLSPDNSDTVILDELNIDELDLYPPDSPHKKKKLNDNALIGLEGMQDALPEKGYNLKLQDIWDMDR